MDLLVQSGILTGHGFDVSFIDAIALKLSSDQTLAQVAAFAPDAVVALAGDASWPEDVRFLRRLLSQGLAPRLFLSGDTPRFEPDRCFSELPSVEAIMTDFTTDGVARLLNGDAEGPGLILQGGKRCPVSERQWSSPPARHDLVARHAYRLPFHDGAPFASVLSSYGCPFSCTFCNTGQLGYKLRPIAETLAEMQLVQQLGYKHMYLRDATANGHRAGLLALCKAMIGADLDLQWNTFCTFKPFDAELAQAMASAGCRVVQMGFETASESLRAATGKSFSNAAALEAVRHAHEVGIKVCGHFVLGLPGQDEDDIRNTARFARELDLDYASFNLAAARPGTDLRDEADRRGLGGGDASDNGFVAGLADVAPERLKRLRRQAILGFYMRPRPLKAVFPDLSSKNGWQQLGRTAAALARVF
jgi:pyruvate-formate lyase-activating enzyme